MPVPVCPSKLALQSLAAHKRFAHAVSILRAWGCKVLLESKLPYEPVTSWRKNRKQSPVAGLSFPHRLLGTDTKQQHTWNTGFSRKWRGFSGCPLL